MRKYLKLFIILIFLGYGLLRFLVGSVLLGQEIELYDFQFFSDPIDDIADFLAKKNDRQIISTSVSGYVGYIALMGIVLSIGALKTLKNKPSGLYFIGAFILMYVLLFVNFQTINPKAIHLGVCIILFIFLLWLKGIFNKTTPTSIK